MAKKAESRLQQKIKKDLRSEVGGKWFKVHGSGFQEAGQPDIIGSVEGFFFGFEVKVPCDGKPSELQLQTLEDWRNEGAVACIVESSSQAIALVKAFTSASSKRRKGRKLYKWICSTLCSTHGEDMGYGRRVGRGKGRNPRRSARWAEDQLKKYLGKVPGGKATLVLGAP